MTDCSSTCSAEALNASFPKTPSTAMSLLEPNGRVKAQEEVNAPPLRTADHVDDQVVRQQDPTSLRQLRRSVRESRTNADKAQ